MPTINDQIITVAERFEGLTEIVSNKEWDDAKTKGIDARALALKGMLKAAGHEDGWPYCMTFSKGVWVTAYTEFVPGNPAIAQIKKLLGPSVMESFSNCMNAGLIATVPMVGAIFFMQNGKSWQGHAGIVERVEDQFVYTIEANTSPGATATQADRDGGIGTGGVWRKKRSRDMTRNPNGLYLRGFLNPIPVG